VLAPFVSAAIFEELRTIANQYAPNVWQMSLGLAMLAIIMFLPGGLWTLVRRRGAA
jgi:branched-chain amino acid transport system permease protein